MSYRVINGKIYSYEDYTKFPTKEKSNTIQNSRFEDVLIKEINKKDSFSISSHAAERLKERNISLNESDMNKINEGINKASQKGSKESIILYKDLVFVASIKNRTIITASVKESNKDNIYTNIDSVVLL